MSESEQASEASYPIEDLYRASRPEALLDTQKPAVRVIVDRFSRFARSALRSRDRGQAAAPGRTGANDVIRPHGVFLIDGSRGAGKTYTLLSVQKALEELTSLCMKDINQNNPWHDFIFKQGALRTPAALREAIAEDGFAYRAAETIRMIFPGDMLGGESIMESIFAHMSATLERRSGILKNQQDHHDGIPEKLNKIKDVQKKLSKVSQGWYFARRFGMEALIRDSIDYTDLITRWSKESKEASFRIDAWRELVNAYLDVNQTVVMVVLVDDSDVDPKLTEDILHAIRMFLNHPRILTVVAGNLRSMRDTLLYLSMSRIGPSIAALNKDGHPTAQDWRRRERQQIEEYLEKVLPQSQRIYVPVAFAPGRNEGGAHKVQQEEGTKPASKTGEGSDFRKVAGQSLSTIIDNAQAALRAEFLQTKFELAFQHELGAVDAPSPEQRDQLEGYIAWWIFGDIYHNQLAPRSARQIANFAEYYERFLGDEVLKARKILTEKPDEQTAYSLRPKRLPVVMFDNPANYSLIHRLSDEDDRLSKWLRGQEIRSHWHGQRQIEINGRVIDHDSYTHRYLLYRLDVGLSMPIRDNSEAVIPEDMLPRPLGRRYVRRFFQPRQMPRRQRQLGICKVINHSVIPGNCVYFHHLEALPDVAFPADGLSRSEVDKLQSGAWEAGIASNWFELMEDRDEVDDDEFLKRYFREIVCEALEGTETLSSTDLINELDPPDLLRKQQSAVYEHFLRDEINMMSANPLERRLLYLSQIELDGEESAICRKIKRRIKQDTELGRWISSEQLAAGRRGSQFQAGSANAPMRMLALYTAMQNDLRRAWLASRIYEGAPKYRSPDSINDESETGQRASLRFIGNSDRMKLHSLETFSGLLKRSEWVSHILTVLTHNRLADESLIATLKSRDTKKNWSELIKDIFSASGERHQVLDTLQFDEEPQDFQRWTRDLRIIGREICRNWPIRDVPDLKLWEEMDHDTDASFERQLFNLSGNTQQAMLKIFNDTRKTLPGSGEDRKKEAQINREKARSARNLVWFLYGIAPSLPAIIHANVMSRVYEAEIQWRAIQDTEYLKEVQSRGEKEGVDTIPEVPKVLRPQEAQDKIRERCLRQFGDPSEPAPDSALGLIDEWARLVGELAVTLRYIKIKCLNLDIALVLRNMSHNGALAEQFMEHIGFQIELSGRLGSDEGSSTKRTVAMHFARTFLNAFSTKDIQTGLAIFPDVSPSTLFGDKWLQDLFSRTEFMKHLPGFEEGKGKRWIVLDVEKWAPETQSSKWLGEGDDAGKIRSALHAVEKINLPTAEISDDPLSVNGVFGETEQWLWSANRTLRKLRQVILERRSAIETDFKAIKRTRRAKR